MHSKTKTSAMKTIVDSLS